MTVFRADLQKNMVAIYTGSRDESVEDNPLANMDRVIFHSDLPYVEAVDKVSGEVLIPAPSNTTWGYYSQVNLFAHGLSYTPLIIPLAHNVYDINGTLWSVIPANLSFPNWRANPRDYFNPPAQGTNGQVGYTNICATDTHVVATTMWNNAIGSVLRFNLKFTVYVTNVALSGTVNPPLSSELIRLDADELKIAGKFSSLDTHFSESGPGDPVHFPMGGGTLVNENIGLRSMAITFNGSKFRGSPYGTKAPIQYSNVSSEANSVSTGSITAKADG
ncbi:hypothetical protein [Roseibium sediminicola]|uniref:Uncharacterized protein n=1 Tax=Roseibium sediminicola TaxID=2933272 RepID=A0ABT0H0G3_9HYPH|nr:hypothetical protein [Roseibium sp. CAU 1639]MCK7615172.1 hypothetical protein [Roseibium sp. CAU 1639]